MTKKIIILISSILLVVIAVSAIIVVTTDVEDPLKKVNEKNLINVDNYNETLSDKRTDGLTVDVNDDGVITVSGENETESDVSINICEVTLEPGKYTLSSSAKGVAKDTYHLVAQTGEGDTLVTIYADDDEDSTFRVEAQTTYTISIIVKAGEEINTTFKPCLAEGSETINFYVWSNN